VRVINVALIFKNMDSELINRIDKLIDTLTGMAQTQYSAIENFRQSFDTAFMSIKASLYDISGYILVGACIIAVALIIVKLLEIYARARVTREQIQAMYLVKYLETNDARYYYLAYGKYPEIARPSPAKPFSVEEVRAMRGKEEEKSESRRGKSIFRYV